MFKLHSNFEPTGNQSQAIKSLVDGIQKGEKYQTLLGVTGAGKTFTMTNIIEREQRPTLILAHNKYRFYFENQLLNWFFFIPKIQKN